MALATPPPVAACSLSGGAMGGFPLWRPSPPRSEPGSLPLRACSTCKSAVRSVSGRGRRAGFRYRAALPVTLSALSP